MSKGDNHYSILATISQEIINAIIIDYDNGQTHNALCSKYGIEDRHIVAIAKKYKLKRNRPTYSKYTPEQKQNVLILRSQGISLKKIEQTTGVSNGNIRLWCKEASIKLNKKQHVANMQRTDSQALIKASELRERGVSLKEIQNFTGLKKSRLKTLFLGTSIPMEKRQKNAVIGKLKASGYNSWDSKMHAIASAKKATFLDKYQDSKTKMKWQCEKGHIFSMSYNHVHSNDNWCPACSTVGPSKAQLEIYEYIKTLLPNEQVNLCDRNLISPKEVDISIPSVKLAIEFDGLFYHSSLMPNFKPGKGVLKYNALRALGYNVFMIFEDEWTNKSTLIKSMIKWRLGKFDGIKLNARNLELKKLEHNSQFESFFNSYHIDGQSRASFAYGLFLNNQMVMCASVRKNFNKEIEIARLATDSRYSVRGGAARLIKAIKDEVQCSLISFSNNRLSHGNVYKTLGFKEITRTTTPSYFYTDFKVRYWRFKFKRINDPIILSQFSEIPHTEEAQAESGVHGFALFGDKKLKFFKIEDYGHRKWELK